MNEKLKELGFEHYQDDIYTKSEHFKGDRFRYIIDIDAVKKEIVFIQIGIRDNYKRDIKRIENDHNNLNTGIKNYWLETLKPLGLKDWSVK